MISWSPSGPIDQSLLPYFPRHRGCIPRNSDKPVGATGLSLVLCRNPRLNLFGNRRITETNPPTWPISWDFLLSSVLLVVLIANDAFRIEQVALAWARAASVSTDERQLAAWRDAVDAE